jgi:hypothetical protein
MKVKWYQHHKHTIYHLLVRGFKNQIEEFFHGRYAKDCKSSNRVTNRVDPQRAYEVVEKDDFNAWALRKLQLSLLIGMKLQKIVRFNLKSHEE